MKLMILSLALLLAGCGASPNMPTSQKPATMKVDAPVVVQPAKELVVCPASIGVEGDLLKITFCGVVDGSKLDEWRDKTGWKEYAIGPAAQTWNIRGHYDSDLRLVYRYHDQQFVEYAHINPQGKCGGCLPPTAPAPVPGPSPEPIPDPLPATCSTLTINDWTRVGNDATIQVWVNADRVGGVIGQIDTYGLPGGERLHHEVISIDHQERVFRIHLGYPEHTGSWAELSCDGKLLKRSKDF